MTNIAKTTGKSSPERRKIIHHHDQKQYVQNDEKSRSLLSILKSFGIVLKVKLNFASAQSGGVGSRCDLFTHLDEQQKCYRGFGLIPDHCERDDKYVFDQSCSKVLFKNMYFQYCVNSHLAKIGIRMKCEHDHLEVVNQVTNVLKSKLQNQEYLSCPAKLSEGSYKSVMDSDRKNCNMMKIDIDLKFKTIKEVVEYLKLDLMENNQSLEDEILSKFVEILDVDTQKKHVYFRLKAFISDNLVENLSAYYLVGKIDGTESCFIYEMTETFSKNRNLTTVDKIYSHFTPDSLRNRIYTKKPNTFRDNREVGIYRVLIGTFFVSITDPTLRHTKYSATWAYDVINSQFDPKLVALPTLCEWKGHGIVVEKYSTNYRKQKHFYGGWVDTGYYRFELRPMSLLYYQYSSEFIQEFYHYVV